MIHHSLAAWDAADTARREACARALLQRLPDGLTYVGLRRYALGCQEREVALYGPAAPRTVPGGRFALVPGGAVQLGFDVAGWWPAPAMVEGWADCAAEWDLPPLPEYLAGILAPPRTVRLPPLLVETEAWEVGWSPVALDDPEVRALAAAHPRTRQVTSGDGEGALRVTRGSDGTLVAERADGTDQSGLLARLDRAGWGLPDPDAWEHLCGAGAGTLFRWGDDAPRDVYPTDANPAEATWRRDWARSGGILARPEGGFLPGFDLHRRPNAFGLRIAENPYLMELTATPGSTRGGDGGVAICGGAGFPLGWLPLATAWRDPAFCEHAPEEAVQPGYVVARRVRALD